MAFAVGGLSLVLVGCSSSDGTVEPQGQEAPELQGQEPPGSRESPDPPAGTFDIAKWREDSNKWAVDKAACLRKDGWAAENFESGPGVTGVRLAEQIPEEQNDDWLAALLKCAEEVGDPPAYPKMTKARLDRLYDYYVEQRECLLGEGFEMPEPPSRESFVANFNTEGWTPWSDLPLRSFGPGGLSELERTCPQEPPAGVL